MSDFWAHPTACIDAPCTIGPDTKVWHFCHVMTGAVVGAGCVLGQGVFVAGGATIGDRVRVQNNVSIYDGVAIEDDVFVGPSAVFTNVVNPRAAIPRRAFFERTLIRRGATIGANATIVPGITVGRHAFVAAGAVVSRDVPDYALVAGAPARRTAWMGRHGQKLSRDPEGAWICPESGLRYREEAGALRCLDLDEDAPLPADQAIATQAYGASSAREAVTAVPFFDRTRGDAVIEGELAATFLRVVRSGQHVLGAEVAAFEEACAQRISARHAIGVSSGTDALIVALLALGIGPGDEVIAPAYTFFATAGAIARLGATPVLVDVDPMTLTMDPDGVARALGPRTRAIVPVHLFGRAADMTRIVEAAAGVPTVEDAAQAFGADHAGKQAGTIGALGCFSFFPTKNLGGFGDGGLVVTDDDALADRVRLLRVHGARPKHHHAIVGGNFRIDALQAALLRVKLAHLDGVVMRRRRLAARYDELFRAASLDGVIGLPAQGGTWNQYVIRVPREGDRDRLRASLARARVGTEIYYPTPVHLQPCFAALGHARGSFPVSEAASRETLALPIFPECTEEEIAYVVDRVRAFFEVGS